MKIKNKMDSFNQRWEINSSINDREEFSKFKTRISNAFNRIDKHITNDSITDFCQYFGIKEVWNQNYTSVWSTFIIDKINNEKNDIELYRIIELIFSLDFKTISYKNQYLLKVKGAFDLSDVAANISRINKEIIIHPKGEKELDSKLVNKPLSFLNESSNKHFTQSLKQYQSKEFIKSAESLRRALEEFLKFKLNNKKGLAVNIKTLQKTWKTNTKKQIRNIFFYTSNHLDEYFNENSKHNDGDITEPENEYLIYQTGLLMRYIDKNIPPK